MRFALPVVLLLLSACSAAPPRPATVADWAFTAKVGLWALDRQESANIDWRVCGERFHIRLSGPLGMGGAVVAGDQQHVVLRRSGEEPVSASSPEALLAELGWYLPVSALRHWLRNQPVPDAPYQRQPLSGEPLRQLEQLGWRIDYQAFDGARPTRIDMEHPDVRLKWIIREWQDEALCPQVRPQRPQPS